MRGSHLGVDKRGADPATMKQHAALSSVLAGLLVEEQEKEVSEGEE